MKIRDFLVDKLYLLIFALFSAIIIFMFLYAIQTNFEIIVIVEILFWIVIFAVIVVEFGRRQSYYKKFQQMLDNLQQKYLITEIMEEPFFIDGKILYNTLRVVDKSMADNVNRYRIAQNDYKSYIEMWVHEIKTPLAAAKLVIQNNPQPAEESLLEEIEKIEGFVDQALYYARSANPEKDYIIQSIILKDVMQPVIRKHAKTFIYKKIKVEMEKLDVEVFSDTKWITFIFDQIISNALKYTPQQTGVIHITTQQKKNAVELFIQDNGIGIGESDLPRIFDKGFTGVNGRCNEKATGMGLYLCKTLCDKLYLSIRAKSSSHAGTTIIITFPISRQMMLK